MIAGRWPLVGVKVVNLRTKDFLDSIVFSRGHDLSHGTDAALSRVVGAADHAGVSSRSSHPLAVSGRASHFVAEVTDERN